MSPADNSMKLPYRLLTHSYVQNCTTHACTRLEQHGIYLHYEQFMTNLAKANGIETPTREEPGSNQQEAEKQTLKSGLP